LDGQASGYRWRWFAEPDRHSGDYLLDARVTEGTNFMSGRLPPLFRLRRGAP